MNCIRDVLVLTLWWKAGRVPGAAGLGKGVGSVRQLPANPSNPQQSTSGLPQ